MLFGDVRGDVPGEAVLMGGRTCASGLRVLDSSDPGVTVLPTAGLLDLGSVFSVEVGLGEVSLFCGLAVRGRSTCGSNPLLAAAFPFDTEEVRSFLTFLSSSPPLPDDCDPDSEVSECGATVIACAKGEGKEGVAANDPACFRC